MSSTPDADSFSLCVGKKPGDGCAGDFPRKDFEGLCAKCLMLEKVEDDPVEFERRQAYGQCMDCGAAAKFFKGEQCGRCRRLQRQETGQEDEAIVGAERAFGHAFQAKMQAGKDKKKALATNGIPPWANPVSVTATSWKELSSVAPSVALTTSSLNNLRNTAKGRLGRMIIVNVTPIISGSTAVWLPQFSQVFHTDTSVADIIQTVLDAMNETWEGSSASSLIRRDVFLLWHQHQNPLPGSLDGTIGELYDIHHRDHNAQGYFGNIPQKWRHMKGESVCFNLDIDVSHFESRTKTSAPPAAFKGKRTAVDRPGPEGHTAKRMRTSLNSSLTVRPLTSNIPKKAVSFGVAPQTTTNVSLRVALVDVGQLDGQVMIKWDTDDKCEAMLDDQPCASGKTKKVYRLRIGGKDYVAKRFFEIGHGRDIVSVDQNSAQLANEMIRLAKGQWFLDHFYERVEETGTQVSSDFIFSQGLLVQEIIGECALAPSPASGVSMEAFMDSTSTNPDTAVTWLLEPLRASSVERWSGTLEHPIHSDKAGKTMDAFMHFSYIYSQRSFIFADLQSTCGRAPSGNGASILFDVMTHTIPQDSGVGDHGSAGIESILNGHVCGAMCEGLEMGEEYAIGTKDVQTRKTRSKGKGKGKGKKTHVVDSSEDSD
ncbi:kinase-like domain-containing protein [Mycena haematopus]|nr:kinase-like domain-containing protein [Mycena haematopus]